MSELFDHQMLPLIVMEELLKQLVADDNVRRKLRMIGVLTRRFTSDINSAGNSI